MSTAGQKFMTELSTRTINAAVSSSSGTEDSLEILRLFKDDYLSADEALHGITENVRGVAQAAPAPEPSLNETAVALLRRAFTAAKLPPKLESDISIFLLALPSTNRVCAHPHCSCPPNARCLA